MRTALELLTTLSDTESHFVIGSDRVIAVPIALKKIGVQHDHNIETVTFDCPRYWDGHDLSTMQGYINYMRSDGEVGAYITHIVVDEVDESIIHFDWTISEHVTEVKGLLSILVCIKAVDEYGDQLYHWNSELNRELYISEGLDVDKTIIDSHPDIITQLLVRMDAVEAVFSPIVEMTPDGDGYVISVTDVRGTKTFTLHHGRSGVHVGSDVPPDDTTVWIDPDGQSTELIPGPKGDTPVKGVDYWTAEDQRTIVDEARAENLLINSDFSNVVDQKQGYFVLDGIAMYDDPELTQLRGYTITGGRVRYIDETYGVLISASPVAYVARGDMRRGYCFLSGYRFDLWTGPSNVVSEICDGYVYIASRSGSLAFYQAVFGLKSGEPVTLCCEDSDGNIYAYNTTVPTSSSKYFKSLPSGAQMWIGIPDETGHTKVGFSMSSGKSASVRWVALYRGLFTVDTLPTYRPNGFAVEYGICRQYDPSTGKHIGLLTVNDKNDLVNWVLEALPKWEGGNY